MSSSSNKTGASTTPITSPSSSIEKPTEQVKADNESPKYPLSSRRLAELSKSHSINIYVGKRPQHELVTNIPRELLAEFAPELRMSLKPIISSKVGFVNFPNSDRPTAAWFVRLAVSGGADLHCLSVHDSPVDIISKRLVFLCNVGLNSGKAYVECMKAFRSALIKGSVHAAHISPFLDMSARTQRHEEAAKSLANTIVNGVLDRSLSVPVCGLHGHKALREEISEILEKRVKHLHWLQATKREPLSTFQVNFVFQFGRPGGDATKAVTRDLLWLFDHGLVKDPASYTRLGRANKAFDDGMEAEIAKAVKAWPKSRQGQKPKRGPRGPRTVTLEQLQKKGR